MNEVICEICGGVRKQISVCDTCGDGEECNVALKRIIAALEDKIISMEDDRKERGE